MTDKLAILSAKKAVERENLAEDRIIGKNIEKLRQSAKLTLEAIAEDAGLSYRYLYDIENGTIGKPLTLETLRLIAFSLLVSLKAITLGYTRHDKEARKGHG